MGLKDLFKRGGGMKDPVRGTAQVVSATMHHGRGIYQNCQMQLVVQADGVPATATSFSGLVHQKRWPSPGMVLPVTVDRADPRKVKVEWDEVQGSDERSQGNAERLAAMMRGEGAPAGGQAGIPSVVNLSGRDLSQLSEEQRAKLRMLGIDPEALAAQQAAGAAATGTPAAPPAGAEEPVDEDIDRLERLARLKEQGVLNDDEFRAQKRRILEE